MKRIGIMLDCARDAARNIETVKRLIDFSKKSDMNALYLYLEDVFEIENEPYFGYLRGRYTLKELKEIDDYAYSQGIEIIPCIQTLAHLNQIFRWEPYYAINDVNDILMLKEEKTYELIDKMFATVSKAFRSKNVNAGMDEAFLLGKGKFYKKYGYQHENKMFFEHIKRVSSLAKKYELNLLVWSDMFYRTANKEGEYYNPHVTFIKNEDHFIPDNISLIYWDYYSFKKDFYNKMFKSHRIFNHRLAFACGVWTWTGFAPSNKFAITTIKPGIEAAIENDIDEVLIAAWGDNGGECSIFSALPAIYYAAQRYKGISKMQDIKDNFYKTFGIKYDDLAKLDLPNILDSKRIHVNPSKYLLYNDPFLGICDASVREGYNAIFKKHATTLSRLAPKLNEYAYLAKYLSSLCKVLSYKAELGVKTRAFYKAHDIEGLKNLTNDYRQSIKYLKIFISNFKEAWKKDNKIEGFEIHEIRLGGLLLRLESSLNTINQFIEGKISHIEELEQDILRLSSKEDEQDLLLLNSYIYNSSPNIL